MEEDLILQFNKLSISMNYMNLPIEIRLIIMKWIRRDRMWRRIQKMEPLLNDAQAEVYDDSMAVWINHEPSKLSLHNGYKFLWDFETCLWQMSKTYAIKDLEARPWAPHRRRIIAPINDRIIASFLIK